MDSVEQSHLLLKRARWWWSALTGFWPLAQTLLNAMQTFHFSPCPRNYLVAMLARALAHLKYFEYHDGMLSLTATPDLNRAENERGRGDTEPCISIATQVPAPQIRIYFLNDQRVKTMGRGIKPGHCRAIQKAVPLFPPSSGERSRGRANCHCLGWHTNSIQGKLV